MQGVLEIRDRKHTDHGASYYYYYYYCVIVTEYDKRLGPLR